MYLVVVMDWFSRYVIAWVVSNTLETGFRLNGLEHSLNQHMPQIFKSDQVVQFASQAWIERVKAEDSAVRAVSMGERRIVFDSL